MLARRSWSSILSVGCTLMFSGAAFSFAATLLQETQKKLAIEAAAVNAAGFAGETTAGEAPQSISDSKSGAVETTDKSKTTSLSDLARVVTVRKSSTTIPNVIAQQFGIPNNERGRMAYFINIAGEGRARNGVIVYERADGTTDIIFSVVAPTKEEGSYYFHTSTDGNLIKAIHTNGRLVVVPNDEASKGFEVQRAAWLEWLARNPPPAVASTDNSSSSGGSSSGGGR